MAITYISGDFPEGAKLVDADGNPALILPGKGILSLPSKIKLEGQVASIEVVDTHQGNWKEKLKSLAGENTNRAQKAVGGAVVGLFLGGGVGAALGAVTAAGAGGQVCFSCTLKNGTRFLASATPSTYRKLATWAAQSQASLRFQYEGFSNAAMAVCAMVATSDGKVNKDEKELVEDFIDSNSMLKVFPAATLKKKFRENCAQLLKPAREYQRAKTALLQEISALAADQDAARAIVLLGIELREADGVLLESEKAVMQDICRVLNLYPGEFGLYYT